MPVAAGVEVDFISAGHLLGSAYARVRVGGTTTLFGGDLGRYDRPVLPDPVTVESADYLLVESTYGDRLHEVDNDGEGLAAVIRVTAERGGKLIIPAFAIGRVEELLYWIARLEEQKRIPVLPVFLDSPMALEALARYTERINELDPELQPEKSDEKAPHDEKAHEPQPRRRAQAAHERRVCTFCTTRFRAIESSAESKQLTQSQMPAIVISSSGMATGGRVLHHLKDALPQPRNTVLLVGFQAAGTRGRQLLDGFTVGQDSRSPGAGAGAHRSHRIDVGARGLRGNPALARGLHGPSQADVPGARRTTRDGRPWRLDRREARLERPHAAPR